ncbi:MAG: hypothetical protein WA919_13700 [Coleofasciculaceae cyanobacterium]
MQFFSWQRKAFGIFTLVIISIVSTSPQLQAKSTEADIANEYLNRPTLSNQGVPGKREEGGTRKF